MVHCHKLQWQWLDYIFVCVTSTSPSRCWLCPQNNGAPIAARPAMSVREGAAAPPRTTSNDAASWPARSARTSWECLTWRQRATWGDFWWREFTTGGTRPGRLRMCIWHCWTAMRRQAVCGAVTWPSVCFVLQVYILIVHVCECTVWYILCM